MKRLLATTLFIAAFVFATFAQQSFKIYRLTSAEYSETFVKAIASEVKLSGEQTEEIRELFRKAGAHQNELFSNPENTIEDRYDAYMNRQKGHLEGNLRIIMGDENYKIYEAAKPAIEKKLQAVAAPAPAKKD